MREPSPERQRQLTLMLFEVALSTSARNGRALPDDVVWLLTRLALNAPGTAARLPHVMAGLTPEVRTAVTRLASQRMAQVASHAQRSDSRTVAAPTVLSVGQAAAALRISSHGVRAACRRGSLHAVKDATGEWRISAADVEARRPHGTDT